MDSDFVAGRWTTASRRRGLALIFAGLLTALSMAIAAPAQAAPSVAVAWGWNQHGELGDGTAEGPEKCGPSQEACSTTPVPVSELSGVTAIAGGETHSLALLENGTVMAWGANSSGQLGDGTTTKSTVPVPVSELSSVIAVAAGSSYSLALLANGMVMAWGANSSGQLGDGTTTKSTTPVAVSGLSEVLAIAAGNSHSMALRTNGTVMAWGANGSGQLGNGSTIKSTVPVAVSGLSGATRIAAGGSHSLALLSGGSVMAWGENTDGELGDGSTTNSNLPVAVSELSGATAIAAGGNHNLALLSSGTVKSWGSNEKGQLGNGTSTGPETCGLNTPCSTKPVAVSGLSGASAIAAGDEEFSLALLSSGSVMAWGANDHGQLGDGTSTGPEPCGLGSCSTTPVAVSTQGVELGISAGAKHALAFGPPPASNGLPEIGRCVKASTPKTGEYKGRKCIQKVAGNKGEYNWLPGPGTKPGIKPRLLSPTLETTTGKKIKCTYIFLEEATVADSKEVKVKKVTGQGCEMIGSGLPCFSNPGEPGTIESTIALNGEIGFIPGSKIAGSPWVGLDLKAESEVSKTVLEFFCGEAKAIPQYKVEVTGSVIGRVKPLNRMVGSKFLLLYKQAGGVQIPTAFTGGVEDFLTQVTTPTGNPLEAKEEQVGLASTGEIELEESLEIRNRQRPA